MVLNNIVKSILDRKTNTQLDEVKPDHSLEVLRMKLKFKYFELIMGRQKT